MTMYKKIALLVSTGFIMLLVLVSVNNFQQSSRFMRGQLHTTAQDTATVLAVAISSANKIDDLAAIEALVNAVFDSGYYSRIRLMANDGSTFYEKVRPLSTRGVPDWFLQLVPLDTAIGTAGLMQGWAPRGELELSLHPGFAYASLYARLVAMLKWFAIIFSGVLIVLWWVLHVLLRPLKSVYLQANAIQRNEFIQQTVLPKTREFRRVVEAMNRVSLNAKTSFEEQQDVLSRYETLLYRDELTGLRNRRFLLTELDRLVSETAAFNGYIVIVKVAGLAALRSQQGYEEADNILQSVAQVFTHTLGERSQDKVARINQDEFALLLTTDKEGAVAILDDIFAQVESQQSGFGEPAHLVAGVVALHSGCVASELLSELDLLVVQALAAGPYQYCFSEVAHLALPQGKTQWRGWIQRALDGGLLFLVAQPVYDSNQRILHKEVLVRLVDQQGGMVPAGVFLPMAQELNLSLPIYREVNRLLKTLAVGGFSGPLALNLSDLFIQNEGAMGELKDILHLLNKAPGSLCVEVSHETMHNYPNQCHKVAALVKDFGQVFGIDQLVLSMPMDALMTFSPSYVKVSARTLEDFSTDETPDGYKALRNLTRTLNIRLIAVGIQDQSLLEHVSTLGVDGVQGNLLGRPEKIV
ncbi:putative signaling protein [Zhongshania aliphaticivorans]|uniref:Putative signaling protein n=1 Tax=Zhongshania aliphaticivorans TaxID=1470434 RepID=A0A5S9PSZ0_9GAMM|nr:LapD/MoxY N-terminal periplasmic domain-containing protein [Zhongshania aliphaticivorans]CAA0107223.1 putative signaling protein [Zhongshania aliphaticivorans]CAA0107302.1 putative signaling protein [Zhongshania aliphaticivorans]